MKCYSMGFGKGKRRISFIHMNKPIEKGLAGMVSSRMFSDNIGVIIDDRFEDDRDYNFACLVCAEGGVAPRILMTRDVYYDIKRGKPYARTILLHEIGHYFNGDLGGNTADRDAQRINSVMNGEVSDEELKADAFAAEYLGKDTVYAGLQTIRQMIEKKYADYDKNSVAQAVREVELRQKLLYGNRCENSQS